MSSDSEQNILNGKIKTQHPQLKSEVPGFKLRTPNSELLTFIFWILPNVS
jgi:hypothetical protein